jgi:DNA-binding transcriptional MerR regulator
MFTTKHVHELFNVTPQTVRNWASEFVSYLSPSATTGNGWRRFTADDLAVFALVKELTEKGRNYSDIHATLKTGQRGDLPSDITYVTSGQINALLVGDVEREFALKVQEIDNLREEIEDLEAKLSKRDVDVGRLEGMNEELRKRNLQLEGLYRSALEASMNGQKDAEFYRGQLEMLKMLLQKKKP